MAIRAHVQTVQPEYGNYRLSSWVKTAVYCFLGEIKSLDVRTEGEGFLGDHWDIEFQNLDAIESVAKQLHEHPDALDKYLDSEPDMIGKNFGENLARLLDEGIAAAKKNGYTTIAIDWF